jgi:hypothetical protein
VAAWNGHLTTGGGSEGVALVELGADLNAHEMQLRCSALRRAAHSGHVEIVEVLVYPGTTHVEYRRKTELLHFTQLLKKGTWMQ